MKIHCAASSGTKYYQIMESSEKNLSTRIELLNECAKLTQENCETPYGKSITTLCQKMTENQCGGTTNLTERDIPLLIASVLELSTGMIQTKIMDLKESNQLMKYILTNTNPIVPEKERKLLYDQC